MSDIAEPTASRSPRPGPVASWVYDNCGEAAYCPPLQAVADGVEAVSRSVGVAGAFEIARDSLGSSIGIDFY